MSTVHQLRPVPPTTDAPISPTARGTFRTWIGSVLREPFFQFVAAGLVIWLGVEHVNALNNRYTIHIGPEQRQRLLVAYQQQFSQPPTSEQLQSIIDRYVTEEIFVREGLALHLAENDEIVRRRIAQKFEFLQTDLAAPPAPAPDVLAAWFRESQARYTVPTQVAFTHVYFSADRDGDDAARTRAITALTTLKTSQVARAPEAGDSFPGPMDVGSIAPDAAERLFGKSQLSEELFAVPTGQWGGPFRSGYGWHLIYVSDKKAPTLPRLEDVRAKVLADYMDTERQRLNAATIDKLRNKYKVVHEGDGT